MGSGSRSDWMESHLLPDQRKRVEIAARIKRLSITDFIVKSIDEAAVQIIQQHEAEAPQTHESKLFLPPLDPALPTPRVHIEKLTETYGMFSVEPLEPGFAVIIRSAMHEMLRWADNQIPTAAITAMRIEGAKNDYPWTVPGVVESVANIGYGLNQILFKLTGDGPKLLRLRFNGPGTAISGMIEADKDVEILDRNVAICTVSDGGRLNMEMSLKLGRGYISEDSNLDADLGADFIPLSSNHRSIREIRFKVAAARRGEPNGYDKLTIGLTTDATVRPTELLHLALDKIRENVTDPAIRKENLGRSIRASMFLNERAGIRSCLAEANISTIGELIQKTEVEVLKFKHSGKKVLQGIKEVLAPLGFSLGMRIDEEGYPQPGPTSVLSSAILAVSLLRLGAESTKYQGD